MITATKYTAATRRALAKYGHEACREAYELNVIHGEGSHSIAIAHDVPGINTTRQADAAINAWAEVVVIFGAASAGMDAVLAVIAKQECGVETLDARNMDALDFHDIGVVSLKAALRRAYEAGKAAR